MEGGGLDQGKAAQPHIARAGGIERHGAAVRVADEMHRAVAAFYKRAHQRGLLPEAERTPPRPVRRSAVAVQVGHQHAIAVAKLVAERAHCAPDEPLLWSRTTGSPRPSSRHSTLLPCISMLGIVCSSSPDCQPWMVAIEPRHAPCAHGAFVLKGGSTAGKCRDWRPGIRARSSAAGLASAYSCRTGLARMHDRLRACFDCELVEDGGDVVAHRLLGKLEMRGDLRVVETLREAFEHFALAHRQAFEFPDALPGEAGTRPRRREIAATRARPRAAGGWASRAARSARPGSGRQAACRPRTGSWHPCGRGQRAAGQRTMAASLRTSIWPMAR